MLIRFLSFVSIFVSFYPNVSSNIEDSSLVQEMKISTWIFFVYVFQKMGEKKILYKTLDKKCFKKDFSKKSKNLM